jgi:N6-adenosine-specific RNA methylase IME4
MSGSLHEIGGRFTTILVDPPWRFTNRTGKVAPEHKRLHRYRTMSFDEIAALPVPKLAHEKSHLYLWCPNALLLEALTIMKSWGFTYKTNIVWYKTRKDGGPDGRGVGFYFRNVTELLLFGVRGNLRTLKPGRTHVNIVTCRKQEHSRKPDQIYDVIERCSPGPYLELFARKRRPGWIQWGDELDVYEQKRRSPKAAAPPTRSDGSIPFPSRPEAGGILQPLLHPPSGGACPNGLLTDRKMTPFQVGQIRPATQSGA